MAFRWPLWATRLVDHVRRSFYFLPTIAVIVGSVAAMFLSSLDDRYDVSTVEGLGWMATTPEAARSILVTIVAALSSVTGVVLSVMMLVLSQTASQFGPRVVRTVVSGNELQITLAALLGTTAFALMTIRTIRVGEEEIAFVPEGSTVLTIVAFFVSIGVLIYFVHHVSQMIQAPIIIERIALELDSAVSRVRDANEKHSDDPISTTQPVDRSPAFTTTVTADCDGYLESVGWESLVEHARAADVFVRSSSLIGDFVRKGDPLVVVESDSALTETCIASFRECHYLGLRRTVTQDVSALVLELAEIATRALSPGINDPRTACSCIDRLGVAVERLLNVLPRQQLIYDDDNVARVERPTNSPVTLIAAAFEEICHFGGSDPIVANRLRSAFEHLRRVDDPIVGKCLDELQRSLKTDTLVRVINDADVHLDAVPA